MNQQPQREHRSKAQQDSDAQFIKDISQGGEPELQGTALQHIGWQLSSVQDTTCTLKGAAEVLAEWHEAEKAQAVRSFASKLKTLDWQLVMNTEGVDDTIDRLLTETLGKEGV